MAIHVSEVQADLETREANERRFNPDRHADVCFACGRGLTEAAVERGWWVEMTVRGMIVPSGTGGDDSQGHFPLGSECAKKVPAELRTRMGAR